MASSKKSIRCAISFLKGYFLSKEFLQIDSGLITICSFISLTVGSLLLGIGVYLLMMIAQFKEEFLTFIDDQVLPITLIALGVFVAITATTGKLSEVNYLQIKLFRALPCMQCTKSCGILS